MFVPFAARFAPVGAPSVAPHVPASDDDAALDPAPGLDTFVADPAPALVIAGFAPADAGAAVAWNGFLFGGVAFMGRDGEKARRPRVARSAVARRPKRRDAAPAKLANERAGEWLEAKLRALGSSAIFRRIASLIWDPPSIEKDVYRWAYASGETKAAAHSHAFHGVGKPLTECVIGAIRPHVRPEWKEDERARIIELGAGDGTLAATITESTGAPVMEVDLAAKAMASDYRLVADFTNLPIANGSYPVAISSFALEYEGLPAFREAHRILAPGGHLIALVHHRGSTLVTTSNFIGRMIAAVAIDGYRFAAGFTPLRFFLPRFILRPWEGLARQALHQRTAAFPNKGKAERMLQEAGFGEVAIETMMVPPIFSPTSKRLMDTGWLITARKPGKGR